MTLSEIDAQIKQIVSDIGQFEEIRPILESARKQTCPGQNDLYNLFCGVLYILKGGIQ